MGYAPENLWLGLDGTVKVMDFGIASDSIKGAHTTGPRGSGTPYYIAPEQLSASPTLDHRADQYSLAIIAYELLTGELPQGAVTAPHLKQPNIPKKLSQSIFRGLNAVPQQRYPDIRAFQHALEYERRMPMIAKMAIGAAACALLGSTGYAFQRYGMPLFETKVSPVWAKVAEQKVTEGNALTFNVRHPDCWLTGKSLKYKLLSDAPVGAQIDTQTGQFQWIPTEAQGPRVYNFNIMAIVEEEGRAPVVEERAFQIAVEEAFDPPLFDTPDAVTIKEHAALELPLQASDPNQPKIGLLYQLVDPPAGMLIDERTGVVQWTPQEDAGGTNPSIAVRVSLATPSLAGANGGAPGNCPANNGQGGSGGPGAGGGPGTCPQGNANGNGGNGNGGNSNNNGTCNGNGNGNGGNNPGLKNKPNLDDLLNGILNRQLPIGKQPELGVRIDDLLRNQAPIGKSNAQTLIEKLPIGKLPIDKLPTNHSTNKRQSPTGLPRNTLPVNNLPLHNLPENNSANNRVPLNKVPINGAAGRQPSKPKSQPYLPPNGNSEPPPARDVHAHGQRLVFALNGRLQ